jgi:hypothetical protein
MKTSAAVACTLAFCLWLSPAARAGQTRGGQGSGGAGRHEGTATSRAEGSHTSTTPEPGRPSGEARPGSGATSAPPPFTSSLGTALIRPSRPKAPFFGGFGGLVLPLYDPLSWAEIPAEGDAPGNQNDIPRSSGGAPARLPSPPPGPSSIQPLAPFRAPSLAVASASGMLRVNLQPSTAQMYVDGFYVGTVEDFSGARAGLNLLPGWHRLEFRAPGYLTPAINVTIDTDRTTTYQGELQPIQR